MPSINDLKSYVFFQGLPDVFLEKIRKLCREEVLQNQDIIFKEGEKAEKIYVLQKGAVSI